MSDLIVVTYPDEYKAGEVLSALSRLEKELLIDMEDVCGWMLAVELPGAERIREIMEAAEAQD